MLLSPDISNYKKKVCGYSVRKLILFLVFVSCTINSYAGNWNVVWQEDFGVVEDSIIRDFADPNMSVPGHKLADSVFMSDGYYGITNSTAWCFTRKKSIFKNEAYNFVPGCDHTGNKNGGMLVVNVGGQGKGENIYENDLKLAVCEGRKYRLTMYVANVSSAILAPNLDLQVYNINDPSDPELLATTNISGSDVAAWPRYEVSTQKTNAHKMREWSETSVEFECKAGDELKIVIKNNCSSGNGNDFAVDDVILERYDEDELISPEIDADLDLTKSNCKATYVINNPELLDAWHEVYDEIYFLWQYSTDNGYTWMNLPEDCGIDKTSLKRDVPDSGNEVYRVIITGGSTAAEAKKKAEYISINETPEDGCDYFSISNIISQVDRVEPLLAYVGIDKDKEKTEQPAYDCTDDIHFVSLIATDNGLISNPYLWQYSYDGLKWFNLDKDYQNFSFSDDFDGLTYFRAILASDNDVLEKVKAGETDEICEKYYYITNTASIECKGSCKTPEFKAEVVEQTICKGDDAVVTWSLEQTNDTKLTDIKWYSRSDDSEEWQLLSGESSTLMTNHPVSNTSYLFLAYNGECVSDSIVLKQIVNDNIELEVKSQISVCDTTADIEVKALVKNGNPATWYWNGEASTENSRTFSKIKHDSIISIYATDGVCTSPIVETLLKVDAIPNVVIKAEPEMPCQFDDVTIVLADSIKLPANAEIHWSKGDAGLVAKNFSLTDLISDKTSYHAIVTAGDCNKKFDIDVDIEKPVTVSIDDLPQILCENESVELAATVELSSINKFKWEKNGKLLSDVELTINDTPLDDATYTFTVMGVNCPVVEKETSVKIEKIGSVTLKKLPETVCEGSIVDLVADVQLSPSNTFKWEKNGELINDSDLITTDTPTEETVYKFSLIGTVCPTVEKEIGVQVEKIASAQFKNVPETVCEGETLKVATELDINPFNVVAWEKNGEQLQSHSSILTDIPTEDVTYKIVVVGLTCPEVEDEVSVKVEKRGTVEINQIPETVCEGSVVDLVADVQLSPSNTFKWEKNGELISDSDLITTDTPTEETVYKFSLIGTVCPTVEKEIGVQVEKLASAQFKNVPETVCEGETLKVATELDINPFNVVAWEKNGEQLQSHSSILTDIPTEDVTYKIVVVGLACPEVEDEVSVKVEKRGTVEINQIPETVCEGSIVDLVADVQLSPSNTFKWEKNGELISDSDLITTDTPTEETVYKFSLIGTVCPTIEKEIGVQVEKIASLEIGEFPKSICEGETIEIPLDLEMGSMNELIVKKDQTSMDVTTVLLDTPIQDATYTFVLKGDVCPDIEKVVSVDVEEKGNVVLDKIPETICEGEFILLKAETEISPDKTFKWEKNGEVFNDSKLMLIDIPAEDVTYKFSLVGTSCPIIEKELSVKVENFVDVDITDVSEYICEGESVELIAEGKLSSDNKLTWYKNDEVLAKDVLSFSDSPKEDASYKIRIDGVVCPIIEHTFDVKVEKLGSVEIKTLPNQICLGEEINVKADVKMSADNSFVWEKNGKQMNEESLSITDRPSEDVTYKLSLVGKVCPTIEDEVTVKVEKVAEVSLKEIAETICEGESVELVAEANLTSVNKFKWEKNGSALNENGLTIVDTPSEDATYKIIVEGTSCPAIEEEIRVKVEKKAEVSFQQIPDAICQGSSVELIAEAKFATVNTFKWEKGSELISAELVASDIPSEDATYKFTLSGNVCPEIEEEISVKVEKKAEVSIQQIPDAICQGGSVELVADAKFTSANTFKWEKNGDLITDTNLTTTDIPTDDVIYKFTIGGVVCPTIENELSIKVEKIADVTLHDTPAEICEGETIDLVAETTLSSDNTFKWEKNGETISDLDLAISDIPVDDAIYKFSVSGVVCPTIEKEVFVSVEEKPEVGLSVSRKEMCEITEVTLTASVSNQTPLVWMQKNDEDNDFTEISEVGDEITVSLTKSASFLVKTKEDGICESVYSDEVMVVKEKVVVPEITGHEDLGDNAYQMIVDYSDKVLYFDFNNGKGKTTSDVIENTVLGKTYTVEVSDTIGCSSTYQFQVPFVELEFPMYFYPEKENWIIKNLEYYPVSVLKIYDRFGKLLYGGDNAVEGWDGVYKGNPLPSTDYWYTLDVQAIDKSYHGHFTLLR